MKINAFKITSPLNFPKSSHIESGKVKYFREIPKWAKNNPRVVIDPARVEEDLLEDLDEDEEEEKEEPKKDIKTDEEKIDEMKEKVDSAKKELENKEESRFECGVCGKKFDSKRGLKIHMSKIHK